VKVVRRKDERLAADVTIFPLPSRFRGGLARWSSSESVEAAAAAAAATTASCRFVRGRLPVVVGGGGGGGGGGGARVCAVAVTAARSAGRHECARYRSAT
jgi:hypothetical protein